MKLTFYDRSLRDVYGEALVALGERDERVVVLDADLNTSTLTSLFKARFPQRFVQCGIAEANMFSVAAGMAYMGYVAFPSTFAAFAARKALDPLFMNICCQRLNVKIPGSYPGLTAAECGPSHNAMEDLAVIRALPHIRVADAGDNYELRALLDACVREDGPVYFRVPRANVVRLFDASYRFEWGKGYELRQGRDAAIVSTGMMTGIALAAANLLEAEGVEATVIHMPSVKPLDGELIVRAARRANCVLTLENGRVYGGFGSAVAECLAQAHPVPMAMMGIADEPSASADLGSLLLYHGLTPSRVRERIAALMRLK